LRAKTIGWPVCVHYPEFVQWYRYGTSKSDIPTIARGDIAMDHLNVRPNSPDYFSASHQAFLASMGQPSAFKVPCAPAFYPSIAPAKPVSFSAAAAPSSAVGVSEAYCSAPQESVGLIRSSLRIAIIGVPVFLGIQSGSWLVGLFYLGIAGLLGNRLECFLETELGELVESILNWSFGMAILSVMFVALSGELSGLGAIKLACLVSIVVAAIQVANYRLAAAREKEAERQRNDDLFNKIAFTSR
jgi:hypothetical protein